MNYMMALLTVLVPRPQADDTAEKLRLTYMAAAEWMMGQQDASGAWRIRRAENPAPSAAYTALVVASLAQGPESLRPLYRGAIDKGARYLLSRANLDGSFGEGESGSYLKTYTTAVTLMALSSVERTDRVADAIRGAQAYLKRNQLKEGLHGGGVGYGDEELRRNADTGEWELKRSAVGNLGALGMAAEGMKASGLSESDEFWSLAVRFARKCQQSTELNADPALLAAYEKKGFAVGNEGGHVYTPEPDEALHRAGVHSVGGRKTFVSYGSMTYEGIKTYLYAGLPKESPEVSAAVDWVRRNYAVDRHPGFSFDRQKRHHLRGLFYYHLALSRALDAFGENPFVTSDGQKHDWPRELAGQFLKSVREGRLWRNDNPAWWEGDEILVTSYVLMTCDVLFKYLR